MNRAQLDLIYNTAIAQAELTNGLPAEATYEVYRLVLAEMPADVIEAVFKAAKERREGLGTKIKRNIPQVEVKITKNQRPE